MKKIDLVKVKELYEIRKLTAKEIAKKYGCSITTILHRMKAAGIRVRSNAEAHAGGKSGENNGNYKHGNCVKDKKFYCIDCKILLKATRYRNDGKNRCLKCAGIYRSKKYTGSGIYNHTLERRKIIGLKSSAKFTPEFKERFRKTCERNGIWVPLDQLEPYEIYFREAEWIESMFKYATETELAFVNSKPRPKFARDHKYCTPYSIKASSKLSIYN